MKAKHLTPTLFNPISCRRYQLLLTCLFWGTSLWHHKRSVGITSVRLIVIRFGLTSLFLMPFYMGEKTRKRARGPKKEKKTQRLGSITKPANWRHFALHFSRAET